MASFLKKFMTKHFSETKLNEEKQLHFLKRLHRLIISGYSLLAALEVMKWDKSMEQTSDEIICVLKEGRSIDEAFERAKFHDTIVAYLYFIRVNGNLITSLDKCILMFEHRITYIKKFKNVIRYPTFLLIIFIFLLLFLKQSVLPSFIELFQSSAESTATVVFSILFIDVITTIFILFVLIILLVFIFWHFYRKRVSIEYQLFIYNKLPIYRSYLKIQTSYYFSTHVSMFLRAGMPMKEVLQNIGHQNKLPILSFYSTLMIDQLKKGFYIDSLLPSLAFVDDQLATIFQKNNNVDSLEQDLIAYADFLSEKLERNIMKIIGFIQPAFFVLLASFIIFIYLTLMWPMFQLIKTV